MRAISSALPPTVLVTRMPKTQMNPAGGPKPLVDCFASVVAALRSLTIVPNTRPSSRIGMLNSARAVATSLSEYLSIVSGICQSWREPERLARPWFRGHEDYRWQLLPGAYRGSWACDYEFEQIRDFRLGALGIVGGELRSSWEWYFVMQHHGVPTRLLDWTESALCGLYFSVRRQKRERDAAVWVLDPFRFNQHTTGEGRIATIEEPLLMPHRPAETLRWAPEGRFPVAVAPPEVISRIKAQVSTFTLHGHDKVALETLSFWESESASRLIKIAIPKEFTVSICDELYVAGIKETTIFPDLDGLGRELRRNYETTIRLNE
jgi:hypothetical protein